MSKEMKTIVAVAIGSVAVRMIIAYYPATAKYF